MGSNAEGATSGVARIVEWIELGGPVVVVLLALSLVALTIIIYKAVQFRGLGRRDFAERALEAHARGDVDGARAALARVNHPLAEVLAVALGDGGAESRVREETARVGAAHLEALRAHLGLLNLIATSSPLLGLLGTVIGMIEAFRQLEAAASRVDPSVLSGGIWEALVTTAVGLAVAIPAAAAAYVLEARVERLGHRMEDFATRIFTTRPAAPATSFSSSMAARCTTCASCPFLLDHDLCELFLQ